MCAPAGALVDTRQPEHVGGTRDAPRRRGDPARGHRRRPRPVSGPAGPVALFWQSAAQCTATPQAVALLAAGRDPAQPRDHRGGVHDWVIRSACRSRADPGDRRALAMPMRHEHHAERKALAERLGGDPVGKARAEQRARDGGGHPWPRRRGTSRRPPAARCASSPHSDTIATMTIEVPMASRMPKLRGLDRQRRARPRSSPPAPTRPVSAPTRSPAGSRTPARALGQPPSRARRPARAPPGGVRGEQHHGTEQQQQRAPTQRPVGHGT